MPGGADDLRRFPYRQEKKIDGDDHTDRNVITSYNRDCNIVHLLRDERCCKNKSMPK